MTTPALQVHDLCVHYGHAVAVAVAVDHVSLTLADASISSIFGVNGTGKTTILNAIVGLLAAQGQLMLHGRDLRVLDIEDRVVMGLSLVPERRTLFDSVSVRDNLLLGTDQRVRQSDRTIRVHWDAVMALFPRLQQRMGLLACTLSGGERQMLAIARASLMKQRS